MARQPTPPVLDRADFSVDGSRLRRSVAARLHAQGFRYCRSCNKVKLLDSFADHSVKPAHGKAAYCKACWLANSRAGHAKESE